MKISYTNLENTLEFSYQSGLEISISPKESKPFYKTSIPELEIMINMMKHHQSIIDHNKRIKTGDWK